MAAISPSFTGQDLGPTTPVDTKIAIFRERVLGWQIQIAEDMARQFFEARKADNPSRAMYHCGFAVVSVVFSYFEMIAQYMEGGSSHHASAQFFSRGFRYVYPTLGFQLDQIQEVYANIRCGMYHNGMTRPGVNLFEGHATTFSIGTNGELLLNPFTLVSDIKRHFLEYCARLDDPTQTGLRKSFESVFDYGLSFADIAEGMGSGSGW